MSTGTSHPIGQNGIFRHILVPTDGSEASMAAGQMAVRLASTQAAQIIFLYVIDQGVIDELARASRRTGAQVRDELAQKGQHYLHYLTRQAESVGVVSVQETRYGVPYQEIHNLARDRGIDLIVMGRAGRPYPQQLRVGDVTARVLDRAPCPVLVVQ